MNIGDYRTGKLLARTNLNEIRLLEDEPDLLTKSTLITNPMYELGKRILHKESGLMKGLLLDFCPRPQELIVNPQGTHLIMEYIRGLTLSEYLNTGVSTEQKLRIAIRLATNLAFMHDRKIIHKDINPLNVIVSENEEQVSIIDFGISTKLTQEQTELNESKVLEGSLSYISPEQTGRMNRNLDYRTDIYSFGLTLFELLWEEPGFPPGEDYLSMVHGHLSLTPEKLLAILEMKDNNLNRNLALIVQKCIEKEPDDRYQSFSAIVYDLEQAALWMQDGFPEQFEPGRRNIPAFFRVSQKIYGREQQQQTLLRLAKECFENGRQHYVNIAGLSGIGKSSLVRSLFREITSQRGLYISGKFDQFSRSTPFAAIKSAFEGYIQHLLTFPKDEIQNTADIFKERL